MLIRIVALLGVVAVGLAPGAKADDLRSAATKVSDCRSIADDTARLTCLDAAALALSLALDENAAEAAPERAPVPLEPQPAPVAEAPSEPKWARAPEPRNKPERQAAVSAPATEPEPVPEKERNVPIWARVFQRTENDEDTVYPVTITRITRNNTGRHFFHTSEGQVWRQTVAEKVRPPKSLPAEAKIEQKIMGSPGLRFVNGPRGEYTVRRIE